MLWASPAKSGRGSAGQDRFPVVWTGLKNGRNSWASKQEPESFQYQGKQEGGIWKLSDNPGGDRRDHIKELQSNFPVLFIYLFLNFLGEVGFEGDGLRKVDEENRKGKMTNFSVLYRKSRASGETQPCFVWGPGPTPVTQGQKVRLALFFLAYSLLRSCSQAAFPSCHIFHVSCSGVVFFFFN